MSVLGRVPDGIPACRYPREVVGHLVAGRPVAYLVVPGFLAAPAERVAARNQVHYAARCAGLRVLAEWQWCREDENGTATTAFRVVLR